MPVFPYTPTWPIASDLPSNAPTTFQRNFTSLDSMIGVDHVPFNSGNNGGYHARVTLAQPILDPNQIAPLASVYSKIIGGVNELCYQNAALPADVYQLTFDAATESGNDGLLGTYGYWLTPWGWRVFMGGAAAANGARTLTLSGATGFGANILTAHATCFGVGPVALAFTANSGLKTAVLNTAANAPAKWLVITD